MLLMAVEHTNKHDGISTCTCDQIGINRRLENAGPQSISCSAIESVGSGLIWQAYLELTIGNSKWPIGGGEFLSSDGPQPGWKKACAVDTTQLNT